MPSINSSSTALNPFDINQGLSDLSIGNAYTSFEWKSGNLSDVTVLSSYINLQRLNLSNNLISTLSPISSLTKLIHLNLDNNSLTDDSLLALKNIDALKYLSLNNNKISSITPIIDYHTFLLSLSISNNQISTIQGLNNCKYLQILIADNNRISNIDSNALPTNSLTCLNLNNNILSDIDKLPICSSLLELHLCHNQLEHLPQTFSTFTPSLHTLNIKSNKIRSLDDLKELQSLQYLRRLTLEGNSLVDNTTNFISKLLYLLPNLKEIDDFPSTAGGGEITPEMVVIAKNAHGENRKYNKAIYQKYLPYSEKSNIYDVDNDSKTNIVKENGLIYSQYYDNSNKVADATKELESAVDDILLLPAVPYYELERSSAYIPENNYWYLLSEKGLIQDWELLLSDLCQTLGDNSNYNKIDLGKLNQPIGDCGLWAISQYITFYYHHNSNSNCNDIYGSKKNKSKISSPPFLTSINLSNIFNPHSSLTTFNNNCGFSLFVTSLSLTNINTLILTHSQLNLHHIRILSEYLRSSNSNSLNYLDLGYNRIGCHKYIDIRNENNKTVDSNTNDNIRYISNINEATTTSADAPPLYERVKLDNNPGLTFLVDALISKNEDNNIKVLILNNNQIDDTGIQKLNELIIDKSCHLNILILSNNLFSNDGLISLSSSIKLNCTITQVNLETNYQSKVDYFGINHTINAIANNRSKNKISELSFSINEKQISTVIDNQKYFRFTPGNLTKVTLKNIFITDQLLIDLNNGIKYNNSLVYLDIENSINKEKNDNINLENKFNLLNTISNTNIEYLNVHYISLDMNIQLLETIVHLLNSKIKDLYIGPIQNSHNNYLEDEKFDTISKLMEEIKAKWNSLYLIGEVNNSISSHYLIPFLTLLLNKSSHLKKLYLSNIVLDQSVISSICQSDIDNSSLEKLVFDHTRVMEDDENSKSSSNSIQIKSGTVTLISSLIKTKTLTSLNLHSTIADNVEFESLCRTLITGNSSITELSVTNSRIGDFDENSIVWNWLSQNEKIHTLNLSNNDLSADDFTCLTSVLTADNSLKNLLNLNLTGNKLSHTQSSLDSIIYLITNLTPILISLHLPLIVIDTSVQISSYWSTLLTALASTVGTESSALERLMLPSDLYQYIDHYKQSLLLSLKEGRHYSIYEVREETEKKDQKETETYFPADIATAIDFEVESINNSWSSFLATNQLIRYQKNEEQLD